MVNPVDRVHGGSWTGAPVGFTVNQGWHRHEGTGASWRAHWSRAYGHFGARELTDGGGKERG
jgi:hypothetical protein